MSPPELLLLASMTVLVFLANVVVGGAIPNETVSSVIRIMNNMAVSSAVTLHPVCIDDSDCWQTHGLDRSHTCFGYVCMPWNDFYPADLRAEMEKLVMGCTAHSDCRLNNNDDDDKCCNGVCCRQDYFEALERLPCNSHHKCRTALLGNQCCFDRRCCTVNIPAPSDEDFVRCSFHFLKRDTWCGNGGASAWTANTGSTRLTSVMAAVALYLMMTA